MLIAKFLSKQIKNFGEIRQKNLTIKFETFTNLLNNIIYFVFKSKKQYFSW
jgi:hypothetical protein